jgi:hypothetical protein
MNSRIGLLTGIALLSASSAFAKPIEIRETQRIDLITNGSADLDAWDVDIDVTGIIVGGRRGVEYGAFMFRRNAAGTWVFKQQLGVSSTAVWPRVAPGGGGQPAARLCEWPVAGGGHRHQPCARRGRSRDVQDVRGFHQLPCLPALVRCFRR